MTQGWECPKCGQVYGPFVQECRYCRVGTMTTCGTAPAWTGGPPSVCPGCGHSPCTGETSGCPLPPQPRITA